MFLLEQTAIVIVM